ncbi:MAG TPA: HPr-rel-A system PqqD family protein [Bacteroidales bacterium]|nr:HPr-rel-A system PqqD family protein [Bacteroidales bacterium]
MKLKRNIAVSESGFLFDPTSGESYSLNEQGLEILNLMKEGKSTPEVNEYMTETYDISSDEFEKYYLDFMGLLRQFKLLEDER